MHYNKCTLPGFSFNHCLPSVYNCELTLLGALPNKSELLIDPEMDQEVEKL